MAHNLASFKILNHMVIGLKVLIRIVIMPKSAFFEEMIKI